MSLPELVDFRLTTDKKKAILFIREGEVFYRKHLDLTKEGAGLWTLNPGCGNATFMRSCKHIAYGEVSGAAFKRYLTQTYITVSVARDLADALAQVFWRKELDFSNWPELEDVQPVQDHLNAAD